MLSLVPVAVFGSFDSSSQVLACSYEAEYHVHTESCYDQAGGLSCGYSDKIIHKHNFYCYGSDGELVCSLPENEYHEHDETCYDEDTGELVCGIDQEGWAVHQHRSSCWVEGPTVGKTAISESSVVGTVYGDYETVYITSQGRDDAVVLFNSGWKFHLGDVSTAYQTAYNDSSWDSVTLPHDFSISQDFTTSGEAESGFLPGGTGWYRKTFVLPKGDEGCDILLNFDGVYSDSYIYVNGTYIGENHYGYNNFAFDITDYVVCDGATENLVAVKVVNNVPSSRWYSGSGIYRDVTMYVLDPVHIDLNGIEVTTPNIANGDGTAKIALDVVNDSSSAQSVHAKVTVYRPGSNESVAATGTSSTVSVAAGGTGTVEMQVVVSNPKLWSIDNGDNLYYTVVELCTSDGTVVDTRSTYFGYRWYSFDSETGFSLNGIPTKLNGVCLHNDQGALGSAAYYEAMARQLEKLKDMGVNAIRITHNPGDQDLVDLCSRMGILVIEELFDGWDYSKNGNSNDFGKWWTTALGSDNQIYGGSASMTWPEYVTRSVVRRDRNQPSVILWSLGNEIQEGASSDANYPTYCQNLITWIQEEDAEADPSLTYYRPTTLGDNTRPTSDTASYVAQAIRVLVNNGGIPGFNYASASVLESLHSYWGTMYSSETSSAVNSRGQYSGQGNMANLDGKFHLTSYDTSKVSWGMTAAQSMWNTLTTDYVAGEFVWTGFDYIGEPTPWNGTGVGSVSGSGPIPNSSYFGIIDTAGFPKDTYYLYRSQWNQNDTTLHLVTAWDSDNMVTVNGQTPVVVYSNAPVVKLYKDDTQVGVATRTVHTTSAGFEYYTYNVTEGMTDILGASRRNQGVEDGTPVILCASTDGQTVKDVCGTGDAWTYWTEIAVEKDTEGSLRVTGINGVGVQKSGDTLPDVGEGFLLMVFSGAENYSGVNVGDYVTCSSDDLWQNTTSSSAIDLTMAFGTAPVSIGDASVNSDGTSLYATFNVEFTDGTISAKAFEADGITEITSVAGTNSITTAGEAAKVAVTVEELTWGDENECLSYIDIDVLDETGSLDTTADNLLTISLSGQGRILGVDNGDQATTQKYQQSSALLSDTEAQIQAYAGKALVIVQNLESGTIDIAVSGDGLTGDAASIEMIVVNDDTDTETTEGPVSCTLIREYSVYTGTTPAMDTYATVTLADGSTVVGTVLWDTSALPSNYYMTAGDYSITGVVSTQNYDDIPVNGKIHVIPLVIAMRNEATATLVGTVPELPSQVVGLMADGNQAGSFDVTWDEVDESMFTVVGDIVVVNGIASTLGEDTLPVTCSVRVAEGTGDTENVAMAASSLTQDCTYTSDNLNAVNNGYKVSEDNTSERWTNWSNRKTSDTATLTFMWDTAQLIDSVNIQYYYDNCAAYPEDILFQYTLDGETWVTVDIAETTLLEAQAHGAEYTYELAQVVNPVGMRVVFTQQGGVSGSNCVGVIELEMMTPATYVAQETTAALTGLTSAGEEIADFDPDTTLYAADSDEIAALADTNMGITILPIYEGYVRVITVSEDGSSTRTYTVYVGDAADLDSYTSVSGMYMWMHLYQYTDGTGWALNGAETTLASWTPNTASASHHYANSYENCVTYTDSDGQDWYLIPESILTEVYGSRGYVFDTSRCPFMYAPDANKATYTYFLYGDWYYRADNATWYLRVTHTGSYSPANVRMNIYYVPLQETNDAVNPSNVSINLFDYWLVGQDVADNVTTNTASGLLEAGINAGHALKFVKDPGSSVEATSLNFWTKSVEPRYGIVENLLYARYPKLTGDTTIGMEETDTESLSYLFEPNAKTEYRAAYENVTGLLHLDENGYYVFDSRQQQTWYNEATNNIVRYVHPGTSTSDTTQNKSYGQFFPLQAPEYAAISTCSDANINHYFGLTMATGFVQSHDGYLNEDKEQPSKFEFSGDDDVWVFIDDVLVADLGGIHDTSTVSIDFVTGEVVINEGTSYEATSTLRAAYETALGAENLAESDWSGDTYANDTSHVLRMFYMERGHNSSNLRLTFNMSTAPEAGLKKVDQVGNPVEGASFALYSATYDPSSGKYYYQMDNGTAIDSLAGLYLDSETGIVYTDETKSVVMITPGYQGYTDSTGNMAFIKSDSGSTITYYSLTELELLLGEHFIMREIDVPDGYRTVTDDAYFYFENGILFCDNVYESGIWPASQMYTTASQSMVVAREYNDMIASSTELSSLLNKVEVEEDGEPRTYYTIDYSGVDDTDGGTLFAVVLKRNGRDFDLGYGYNFWYPVYGTNEVGYTTVKVGLPDEDVEYYIENGWNGAELSHENSPVNIEAAIAAIQAQQLISYGSNIFGANQYGIVAVDIDDLPGKIDRYYNYLYANNMVEFGDPYDPQYVVAYYWTSADNVMDATVDNTMRVQSDLSVVPGISGTQYTTFTTEWRTTLEVPDMRQRLYFQKLDEAGEAVDDAAFALYSAQEMEVVYQDGSSEQVVFYKTNTEGTYVSLVAGNGLPNTGTAWIYDASGVQSTEPVADYEINSATGEITVVMRDGSATYTISPAVNASGDSLYGRTTPAGEDCGLDGSGMFDLIPDGQYLLREVSTPLGYILNDTETPVLVCGDGVFANAGSSDNGVDVGNGVGYLTKTLDVFASQGEIDETLTWVYSMLLVNTTDQSFQAISQNLDFSDIETSIGTKGWVYANDSDADRTEPGFGDTTTTDKYEALVTYLEFWGDADVDDGYLFNYAPVDNQSARTGTAEGEGTMRLFTDEGWSALAVYQDYEYGVTQTAAETLYENLATTYGVTNIAGLFSNSTTVRYVNLSATPELPETGGPGLIGTASTGLLMMAVACGMIAAVYMGKKRYREGGDR